MKEKVEIIFWVFLAIFSVVVFVSNAKADAQPNSRGVRLLDITGTPTAFAYLPLVLRQPTPTPLPTATPLPTPRPRLNDGYYEHSSAFGTLWFTVIEGGSKASNGGFIFDSPYCPNGAYSFYGYVPITNGYFGVGVNYTGMMCVSNTSDRATCTVVYPGLGGSQCSSLTYTATRR